MSSRPIRGRSWAFTCQVGPTSTDGHKLVRAALESMAKVTFIVCQLEVAPTTNQRHVQGYVHFNEGVTLSQIKNHLNPKGFFPHLEVARGSVEENVKYCTKEETRLAGAPTWFCGLRAMEYYIRLFDFDLFTSDRLIPLSVDGSSRHLVPDEVVFSYVP